MPEYFVAKVAQMPGTLPSQTGTFYTVASATDATDACQQIANQLIAGGTAVPEFLIGVPASSAQAVAITLNTSVVPQVIPAPATPAVASAAAVAPSASVTLTWGADANATFFLVQKSDTSGGPYTTLAQQTATSYVDTVVQAGVTYYYLVVAVNMNGQAPSPEIPVLVT